MAAAVSYLHIEKRDGELYNVEFATFNAVKDPLKMKK